MAIATARLLRRRGRSACTSSRSPATSSCCKTDLYSPWSCEVSSSKLRRMLSRAAWAMRSALSRAVCGDSPCSMMSALSSEMLRSLSASWSMTCFS